MENENQDTVTTTTDEIVDLEEATEDVDALRQRLADAEEAKRQLTARAHAAEKALKTAKPITSEYSINDEVVDLRLDGYSKEDVEFIVKNGGRKALEDKSSYVAIAIATKREQARAEAEANKVTDTSGKTEVERKYTTEQLQNMSVAELKKILPHA